MPRTGPAAGARTESVGREQIVGRAEVMGPEGLRHDAAPRSDADRVERTRAIPRPAAAGTTTSYADPRGLGKKDPGRAGAGKRVALPVVLALLVLGGLGAVSAYVWPGWVPKTFSQTGLEAGVQHVLADEGGKQQREITDVACPAGVKARKGEEFTCQLKVNGQPKYVTITVLDDDGNYLVSDPVD